MKGDARAADAPVKSALRAFEILELFDDLQCPLTAADIRARLGYPQSSLSMLLKTLAARGYLDFDPRTRQFQPSLRTALLGSFVEQAQFGADVPLLMGELARRTGGTVMLAALNANFAQFVHLVVNPAHKAPLYPGCLRPMFRSAVGRMLLSTWDDQRIELLGRRANAEGMGEPLDLGHLRDDMQMVREQRHACTLDRGVPGLGAVAVLLPLARLRRPIALGIGCASLVMATQKETFLAELAAAIDRLSAPAGH